MENKKLLNYLIKDLSELDEMFAEQGKISFDAFEIEFIKNRIAGATKLIQMFLDKENSLLSENKTEITLPQNPEQAIPKTSKTEKEEIKEEENIQENPAVKTAGIWVEEKAPEVVSKKVKLEEKAAEPFVEEKAEVVENKNIATEILQEKEIETKEQVAELSCESVQSNKNTFQEELELEEDEPTEIHNRRLGDSFFKEKSVNDSRSDDMSKLEHKLSNRPVSSIQSAIGINDRFQYIRELFEGSADNFVKAVSDLDSMNDIKEAVDYMQKNFKWKKNESSLKFVNLIKRRFPHE
jgi:hypothetical protein